MAKSGAPQKTGLRANGIRFGIVVSEFNKDITGKLLTGCTDTLKKCGAGASKINVVRVPGAFEIPLAALKLAKQKKVDCIICLGAIIKGKTMHFEYIAEATAMGIMRVMLDEGLPCVFGVITPQTHKQAKERSSGKRNKGIEAAYSAIEMAQLKF